MRGMTNRDKELSIVLQIQIKNFYGLISVNLPNKFDTSYLELSDTVKLL